MSRAIEPDPQALRLIAESLSYDPSTGDVTWKGVRLGRRARIGQQAGGKDGRGYRTVMLAGKTYKISRIAWFFIHGSWPPSNRLVDHENGILDVNRETNLRLATHSNNMHNQGRRVTNTSGFKGVSWFKPSRKWRAAITCNGKTRHIGLFDDVEDAASAYAMAAHNLHGEFARLE